MKIALLVEGDSDERTLKILTRKIVGGNVDIVPRVIGRGKLFDPDKVSSFIKNDILQEHPDVTKVFAFVDSHCTPENETERRIRNVEKRLKRGLDKGIICPVYYIGVIHELEGWLLGDHDGIRRYLCAGRELEIPSSAHTECKPKEIMKDIFKKMDKGFRPTFHNPQIADRIEIERISKKNKSFKKFHDKIIDP